jgi:signal transduction histidine kinase
MAKVTWGRKIGALLGFAFVFGLSAIFAIMSPLRGLAKIDTASIRVFEPSAVSLPLQVEAAQRVETMARRSTFGWERAVQFHLPNQNAQMVPKAILIAAAGGRTNLYINGINIAQAEAQQLPGRVRGGYILAQSVSPTILNAGENRVDIVMGSDYWRTAMPDVRTGTPTQIEAAFKHTQQATRLVAATTALAGLIGLLISPVILLLTRSFFLSFGGAIIGGVMLFMSGSGFGFFDPSILQMLAPLVPWLIIAGSIIGAIGCWALDGRIGGLWLGLSLSCAFASFFSLSAGAAQGALPFILAINDVAPIILTGVGMPALVVLGTTKLIRQRSEAQAEANRQAHVVALQADEIQRQAQSLAITEERKRFSRDIHDGIGGQLVSLLWRVRSETVPTDELAGELERGLADLRLVVDALDDGPLNLSEAMWNFAARARQQLEAANIEFSWHIPETLDVAWQDSRRILSLYRMLQEVTSNVVRHSGAQAFLIKFSAEPSLGPSALRVLIEDNGIGIRPETRRSGRGLTNLSMRAQQLGGTITFAQPASGRGTRIEIVLPPEIPMKA